MNRKVVIAVATGMGALLLIALGVKLLRGDARIQRGRELLSIDEVDGAVVEFKLALKQHPDDRLAKAYLMFATGRREQGVDKLLARNEVARLVATPSFSERASPALRDELEAVVKAERRRLYEAGVDTASAAELVSLVDEVARICFDECGDGQARDAAASVLARQGRADALAFLVQRLKSETALGVEAQLAGVGEKAAQALLSELRNPEYLARARALRTLAQIGIGAAARRLFEETPTLRGLSWDDVPEDLRIPGARELFERGVAAALTRSQLTQGFPSDQSPKTRLHAEWLGFDDKGERALLLLQGIDTARTSVAARALIFREGRWDPVTFTRAGQAIQNALEGGGPVVRIRTSPSGRVEFLKVARGVVEEERLVERRAYRSGDRVAISGQPARGVVVGPGMYGLVKVRLTEEWDGRLEHDLAPEFLRFVETVQVDRARFRVITGRLVGDGTTIDLDTDASLVESPPEAPLDGGS